MTDLNELKERIVKSKLTKKESEIAEYILNNVSKACFMTASDLAKELDTSNTSVNRMAKAIGYYTFVNLQKELQDYVASQAESTDKFVLPPMHRITSGEADSDFEETLVKKMYEMTSNNLISVLSKNSSEKIDRVVEIIATSERRYINGIRGTVDIANKLAYLLKLLVSNVTQVVGEEIDNIEKLIDIAQNDCIVVFSFNRYHVNTRNFIELAKARHAKVILITDRATAPFSQYADELLIVDVESLSYFNSNIAPMFLIEIICTKLALKLGDQAKTRLSILEPYINRSQIL
jgi:DNA-binding MurR/RpiR family transcriptional regulator